MLTPLLVLLSSSVSSVVVGIVVRGLIDGCGAIVGGNVIVMIVGCSVVGVMGV